MKLLLSLLFCWEEINALEYWLRPVLIKIYIKRYEMWYECITTNNLLYSNNNLQIISNFLTLAMLNTAILLILYQILEKLFFTTPAPTAPTTPTLISLDMKLLLHSLQLAASRARTLPQFWLMCFNIIFLYILLFLLLMFLSCNYIAINSITLFAGLCTLCKLSSLSIFFLCYTTMQALGAGDSVPLWIVLTSGIVVIMAAVYGFFFFLFL